MITRNNSTFALRKVNGESVAEISLEDIFKGDLTKNLDDPLKIKKQVETIEIKALQALQKVCPVGTDGLELYVVPDGATGEIMSPSNQSSALTATFDTLVYDIYSHPWTDVSLHIRSAFDVEGYEDNNVGYINKSYTSGIDWLGCNPPRWQSNYSWYRIGFRNKNFYLLSLDGGFRSRSREDIVRQAQNTQVKHDYIDFLLKRISFKINVSVNRKYAIGFLYQLLLDEASGIKVRNTHINQAIEKRTTWQDERLNGGNGNGSDKEQKGQPGPVPTVTLRHFQNPRHTVVLNEGNIGKSVLHYESGRKISSGTGTLWDGTEDTAKMLKDLNSISVRYGFEIV